MIELPRLLVLTDRSQLPLGRSLRAHLRDCAEAGLTHVVVRELDLAPAQRAALARDLAGLGLQVIAARTPLPGCAGVHLAAHQPVADAAGIPFGRSCHSRADVVASAAEGASYAFLSPWAAGGTKPGRIPLPHDDFDEQAIPVLALGGVTPANAAQARAAGAHGVAAMGKVMRAVDPGQVIHELLEATR